MTRQFTLTINCDNAAFSPWAGRELARMLANVGKRLEDGRDDGYIWDHNGNNVGAYSLDLEDDG